MKLFELQSLYHCINMRNDRYNAIVTLVREYNVSNIRCGEESSKTDVSSDAALMYYHYITFISQQQNIVQCPIHLERQNLSRAWKLSCQIIYTRIVNARFARRIVSQSNFKCLFQIDQSQSLEVTVSSPSLFRIGLTGRS